jgi:hypothetical protein
MAGVFLAIHLFAYTAALKTWIPATTAGMTVERPSS